MTTNQVDEKIMEEYKKLKELKQKSDDRSKRLRVKNTIMLEKCRKQGIVVSEKEIDEYIKNMK